MTSTTNKRSRWDKARKLRLEGKSQTATAKEIGVSRQAVAKQEVRRGWFNQTPTATIEGLTPREAIIASFRNGHPVRVAAGIAGVHYNTVYNWMKKDEAFATECLKAMALYSADRIHDMNRASERGDMRATNALLQAHELTREHFGPEKSDTKLTIILNIARDGGEPKPIVWGKNTFDQRKIIEHGE